MEGEREYGRWKKGTCQIMNQQVVRYKREGLHVWISVCTIYSRLGTVGSHYLAHIPTQHTDREREHWVYRGRCQKPCKVAFFVSVQVLLIILGYSGKELSNS